MMAMFSVDLDVTAVTWQSSSVLYSFGCTSVSDYCKSRRKLRATTLLRREGPFREGPTEVKSPK